MKLSRRLLAVTAVVGLLALSIPLAIGIGMVTSMGSGALPEMFAFGIAGWQLARSKDVIRVGRPEDQLV